VTTHHEVLTSFQLICENTKWKRKKQILLFFSTIFEENIQSNNLQNFARTDGLSLLYSHAAAMTSKHNQYVSPKDSVVEQHAVGKLNWLVSRIQNVFP
jgi:hypothetical protein